MKMLLRIRPLTELVEERVVAERRVRKWDHDIYVFIDCRMCGKVVSYNTSRNEVPFELHAIEKCICLPCYETFAVNPRRSERDLRVAFQLMCRRCDAVIVCKQADLAVYKRAHLCERCTAANMHNLTSLI